MHHDTFGYLAHFGRHEVAQPVEPLHIGLEVSRLLHVLERCLEVRILLGERLNELLRPDVGQTLQLHVCQLLCQKGRTWTQLSYVRLKQDIPSVIWAGIRGGRRFVGSNTLWEKVPNATSPLNASAFAERPAVNILI